MNAEDVARYLVANPQFFEQYADVLAQIHVPHPHGGGNAIALADRQVIALRDKAKALEAKLAELIQFGEENDAISEKVHRLGCALMAAPAPDVFEAALHFNLREDFAVPHAALCVWDGGEEANRDGASAAARAYAASLSQPFCGPVPSAEIGSLFGEAGSHVRSVAVVPIRRPVAAGVEGECIGLLALGSEDAMRFHPGMGTLYLKRIGELVGAGLARFAPAR